MKSTQGTDSSKKNQAHKSKSTIRKFYLRSGSVEAKEVTMQWLRNRTLERSALTFGH